MNVSRSLELERLVNEKVSSGLYQTADDVVREALILLKERDAARDQLRSDVRAGFAELAREEGSTYDASDGQVLADHIKSRGRVQKADR